ncbi:oligosaccharide flippase family protein [Flavobacterium sp. PL002]|uniref:oligosaccharide flippase family protein n=1 Tax=Flavobacterium sp. PL002 TaxID=1897058 RepID=UPI00178812B3|nr:oligosaccharide flippase family protein [Flavobacterium sp. PL002]
MKKIRSFISKLRYNKLIIENYFFMTVLQLLNSLFYIIIYPFIIRKLGAENYGTYVFSLSIVTYFIVFISFGFDLPSLNKISKDSENFELKSKTISDVFTSKLYLFFASSILFFLLLFFVRSLEKYSVILFVVYFQTILSVLVPTWYFQGVQKMKIVTYFQIVFKVLSLPFIFFFVSSSDDLDLFSIIMTVSTLFSGISIFGYLLFVEKLNIRLVSFLNVKTTISEALPFFWSSSTSIIRQQSTNIIIGIFIGMNGVAYFDLASKLILLPQSLAMSINGALFPKVVSSEKVDRSLVKKIINYEIYFGLFVILMIALFAKYAILFLGGPGMMPAYNLTLMLSITILTWLVVGCYINFIFVPQNKYYFITYNQLVAFFVYILVSIIGVLIYKDIYVIVIATVISGFAEVAYCKYVINKNKLFN